MVSPSPRSGEVWLNVCKALVGTHQHLLLLPGSPCVMVVSPAGGRCSQVVRWAASLTVVVTRGGSVGTVGLTIAGPTGRARGFNVCYGR